MPTGATMSYRSSVRHSDIRNKCVSREERHITHCRGARCCYQEAADRQDVAVVDCWIEPCPRPAVPVRMVAHGCGSMQGGGRVTADNRTLLEHTPVADLAIDERRRPHAVALRRIDVDAQRVSPFSRAATRWRPSRLAMSPGSHSKALALLVA
jgi:hypothetical protein